MFPNLDFQVRLSPFSIPPSVPRPVDPFKIPSCFQKQLSVSSRQTGLFAILPAFHSFSVTSMSSGFFGLRGSFKLKTDASE